MNCGPLVLVAGIPGITSPPAVEVGASLSDCLSSAVSTQAVGEPPLFLASSIFFAIKDAIRAARAQHTDNTKELFRLDSPATPEKIRNACIDKFTTLV